MNRKTEERERRAVQWGQAGIDRSRTRTTERRVMIRSRGLHGTGPDRIITDPKLDLQCLDPFGSISFFNTGSSTVPCLSNPIFGPHPFGSVWNRSRVNIAQPNFSFPCLLVVNDLELRPDPAWGPFLEGPEKFSDPESHNKNLQP